MLNQMNLFYQNQSNSVWVLFSKISAQLNLFIYLKNKKLTLLKFRRVKNGRGWTILQSSDWGMGSPRCVAFQ